MTRLVALFLLAITLNGCTAATFGLAPSAPPTAYSLRGAQNAAAALRPVQWQLLVEEPSTVTRFDSPRIALALGSRLDYYADVAWADRAPVVIQAALVESFERSGKIGTVARDAAGVRGDLSLKTDLREFQANYPSGNTNVPPEVTVRIAAKLVEPQRREVVASENFDVTLRSPSARLNEIAATFDAALQQALARIVEWTLVQGTQAISGGARPTAAPAATRSRRR